MNRSIDSSSDFYAPGATFYRMLTGGLPFTAADPCRAAEGDPGRRLGHRYAREAGRRPLSDGCPPRKRPSVNGGQDRYRMRGRVSRLPGLTVGVVTHLI
jgi:hypothetical protein